MLSDINKQIDITQKAVDEYHVRVTSVVASKEDVAEYLKLVLANQLIIMKYMVVFR